MTLLVCSQMEAPDYLAGFDSLSHLLSHFYEGVL